MMCMFHGVKGDQRHKLILAYHDSIDQMRQYVNYWTACYTNTCEFFMLLNVNVMHFQTLNALNFANNEIMNNYTQIFLQFV